MRRHEGRAVLVVGGGQTPGGTMGNGRAAAILYAREGADVYVADRDVESAEATCGLVASEGGASHSGFVDVTVDADVAQLVDAALAALGRIDIVHHNVGTASGDRGATSLPEADWDRIVDTNLKGAWLTAKHALPHMRAAGRGTIVYISSIAAVTTLNMIAYTASKAGLNALTRQLAIANARFGIRVNAVMPGMIETPIAIEGLAAATRRSSEEIAAERHASVPLGHMGTAWDVAHAASFLASDEAAFITGVVLPVDGGQTCRAG
ncbi:MAG TPA: SDR family NAD(P)-dependent oxidoreductase [Acidimicrobiales bacterium]|jgi:NAD(P)-dependent dehydrogenase (short-subunit alcohol dehydrogenase family)